MGRWTVARMLAFVAFVAVGLAAMRQATDLVASLTLWLIYSVLVVTTLVAAFRWRRDGAWLGFAVFGWGYFLPVFVFASQPVVTGLPTSQLLAAYVFRTTPVPAAPPGIDFKRDEGNPLQMGSFYNPSYPRNLVDLDFPRTAINAFNARVSAAVTVGHLLLTLLLAWVGAILGRWLGRTYAPGATGDL